MVNYKKQQILTTSLFIILIILIANLVIENVIETFNSSEDDIIILIDPGHGGRDPGKVGVNDSLEKDINLAISIKLKSFLEQKNYKVIMTRTEDVGLYKETDSNKKREDLKNRVKCVEDNNADIMVSIHQNSFGDSKQKGAQVFYYTNSEEGQKLANKIQEEIIRVTNPDIGRKEKENSSYYMLKESSCTSVIVECGFLSNYEEAELLTTESYQNDLAWSIYMGIVKYLNDKDK